MARIRYPRSQPFRSLLTALAMFVVFASGRYFADVLTQAEKPASALIAVGAATAILGFGSFYLALRNDWDKSGDQRTLSPTATLIARGIFALLLGGYALSIWFDARELATGVITGIDAYWFGMKIVLFAALAKAVATQFLRKEARS